MFLGDSGLIETNPHSAIVSQSPLVGTHWVLARLGSQPVSAAPPPDLRFNAAAEPPHCAGAAGCNRFTGSYQLAAPFMVVAMPTQENFGTGGETIYPNNKPPAPLPQLLALDEGSVTEPATCELRAPDRGRWPTKACRRHNRSP